MNSFSLPISVVGSDIDRMGHVNNSIYLRWIEEAVHSHWTALATPSEFAAYQWVAVRHEIDYQRPAVEGNQILVDTRIDRVRRVRAWYQTIVRRESTVLVEARSCWVCVSTATGALNVISQQMIERFMSN